MEAIKEPTQPDKPDIMAQLAALLQSAGYAGLGVVAIGPRTGSAANPLDFLPEGWQLQIVPINGRNTVLPEKN